MRFRFYSRRRSESFIVQSMVGTYLSRCGVLRGGSSSGELPPPPHLHILRPTGSTQTGNEHHTTTMCGMTSAMRTLPGPQGFTVLVLWDGDAGHMGLYVHDPPRHDRALDRCLTVASGSVQHVQASCGSCHLLILPCLSRTPGRHVTRCRDQACLPNIVDTSGSHAVEGGGVEPGARSTTYTWMILISIDTRLGSGKLVGIRYK